MCYGTNFLFIEPIGTKAPAFSNDVQMIGYRRESDHSLALLCPAQAFPFPSFRYYFTDAFLFRAEPVGLKAPSFSSLSKIFSYDVHEGKGFVLLCPAQAQPVPMFRYCCYCFVFIETCCHFCCG